MPIQGLVGSLTPLGFSLTTLRMSGLEDKIYEGEQKKVHDCEYVKHSFFLYYYLLIITLFVIIIIIINLFLHTPVQQQLI